MRSMKEISVSIIVLLFGIILLGTGCQKNNVNDKEYLTYVSGEKNGLKKRKQVKDIIFEVQYKTPEYVLLKEGLNKGTLEWEERYEKTKQNYFFDIRLSVKNSNYGILKYNIQDYDDYNQRLYYFAFKVNEDIMMIDGRDSIPCSFHHFERTYDLAGHNTILVGFSPKAKQKGDKTLIINSPFLFSGPVKFNIKQSDIDRIPNLM